MELLVPSLGLTAIRNLLDTGRVSDGENVSFPDLFPLG